MARIRPMRVWPGSPCSPRRDVRRIGRQFRAVLGARDERRALPVRSADARVEHARVPLSSGPTLVWHAYLSRHSARPALRLSGLGPLGPGERAPLQPRQGRAGSLRARDRPRRSVATRRCSPTSPARAGERTDRSHRQRALRAARRGRSAARAVRRGGADRRPRTPWRDTVIYELHVKGFTALNPAHPGAPARHVSSVSRPRLRSSTSRRLASRRSS